MSRKSLWTVKGAFCAFFCFWASHGAAQTGFDSGLRPRELLSELKATPELSSATASWLRVRGIEEPGTWWKIGAPGNFWRVWRERWALQAIHRRGQHVCVFVMPKWPDSGGQKSDGGGRMTLPLDLREAYRWGFRLGKTYGDVVDAWEVSNEPDLAFVPENAETYAAYLKACYLGIKRGSAPRVENGKVTGESSEGVSLDLAVSGPSTFNPQLSTARVPLVLMAPLALPPGPYWEALAKNGVLSYTDGFNYHYYGYAEDFSGVYKQFENALTTDSSDGGGAVDRLNGVAEDKGAETGRQRTDPASLGGAELRRAGGGDLMADVRSQISAIRRQSSVVSHRSSGLAGTRWLPVFLTEYGYGSLSGLARNTIEGRVSQWRWFHDAATQARELRIQGPMAFYLPPYLENGMNEFGLSLLRSTKSSHEGQAAVDGGAKTELSTFNRQLSTSAETAHAVDQFEAGGLRFTPKDFGADATEPWMTGIGKKIGSVQASPALAWLLDRTEVATGTSHDWAVHAGPPSPVVIDFVAARELIALKQCQGYVLPSAGSPLASAGELRVYNFGATPITGELQLGMAAGGNVMPLTLAPGELRVEPVVLRVADDRFAPSEWVVKFYPAKSDQAESVFSTRLFPSATGMTRKELASLMRGSAGEQNAANLAGQVLAREEPAETLSGRWRVTEGLRVEENESGWAFTVSAFPRQPLRPAIAELILPDDFRFPENSLLELDCRLAPRLQEECAPVAEPRAPVAMAHVDRELIGIYWRTENGNLYTVWQLPDPVTFEWQHYAQMRESYTMGFYGRAKLPWRFGENRPVALVFRFRPNFLPAKFEVKRVVIASYAR